MKKYLLSLISALFLIACNQGDSSAPKVSKPSKEKETKESKDSKEPPTAPKHYME
jgi:PBP1b-binding outer membrane lipoprotein LpoB